MASQMGPKGLARTFEKEKIMRYGKKVFLLECGLPSQCHQHFTSTFRANFLSTKIYKPKL